MDLTRKRICVSVISVLATLWVGGANSAALTLDDFVPPSEGGSVEPENPVEDSGDAVIGTSMQDTMGYAYQQLMDEGGNGIRTVQTKTGLGILATGTAGYNVYDNINATLLSKRQAYVLAFTNAQGQLVKHMEGFESHCEQGIEADTLAIDTGSDSLGNSEASSSEVCSEITSGLLSSYITYAVDDNVENKTVAVTVASTTKTRSAVDRVGGAVIATSDPGKAFEHIAREVSQGVVPPVGAKLIMNPENGEAIVIGFGSSIIRDNKNPTMKAKMREMANRQSQLRANSALLSFLTNSEVYWEGGFDESQLDSQEQFEVPVDEQGNPGDPVAFDEMRSQFLNVTQMSDDYKRWPGSTWGKNKIISQRGWILDEYHCHLYAFKRSVCKTSE